MYKRCFSEKQNHNVFKARNLTIFMIKGNTNSNDDAAATVKWRMIAIHGEYILYLYKICFLRLETLLINVFIIKSTYTLCVLTVIIIVNITERQKASFC